VRRTTSAAACAAVTAASAAAAEAMATVKACLLCSSSASLSVFSFDGSGAVIEGNLLLFSLPNIHFLLFSFRKKKVLLVSHKLTQKP